MKGLRGGKPLKLQVNKFASTNELIDDPLAILTPSNHLHAHEIQLTFERPTK